MSILSGPVRKPRSGKAQQLVILLHGWGADGPNLIDLGDAFASVLPEAQFIAPNAPHVCEANPYGYQWFSLMDRQPQHMLEGVRNAAKVVNNFINEQLKLLTLDDSKLALVGFSQGTMVGLQVAMRRAPAMAGLVGFSGALIVPETLAQEITARPPVCLIHGKADDVVPFSSLQHAVDTLKSNNVLVEAHTRPFLSHSIDMEGIKIAGEFLKRVFYMPPGR
jgi:phospholipase/carboxylesterase